MKGSPPVDSAMPSSKSCADALQGGRPSHTIVTLLGLREAYGPAAVESSVVGIIAVELRAAAELCFGQFFRCDPVALDRHFIERNQIFFFEEAQEAASVDDEVLL